MMGVYFCVFCSTNVLLPSLSFQFPGGRRHFLSRNNGTIPEQASIPLLIDGCMTPVGYNAVTEMKRIDTPSQSWRGASKR